MTVPEAKSLTVAELVFELLSMPPKAQVKIHVDPEEDPSHVGELLYVDFHEQTGLVWIQSDAQ
jgi:hypothetical protein